MRLLVTSVIVVILIASTAYSLETGTSNYSPEREEILFQEIPVVVAASRFEQKITEVPSIVTIITADDIKKFGYQSLAEAIRGVTGFYVSSDREYSRIGVRGYERAGDWGNRILIMINSHYLNEDIYGSALVENAVGIDIGDVKRIEIVRGPGSALYGTNAFFAVINVVTKTWEDRDGLDTRVSYGTNNTNKETFSLIKKLDKDVDILISGSTLNSEGNKKLYFKEYDSPSTNNGWAEDCDMEKTYSIFANLNYGDISIMANTNSRNKNYPTAAYGTVFNDTNASEVDQRSFAEMKFQPKLSSDKTAAFRLYYDSYHYVGNFPFDFPPVIINQDDSEGNWWGGDAHLQWDITSDNKLIVGAEYQSHTKVLMQNYNTVPHIMVFSTYNRPYNLCSLYMEDEIKTKNVAISIGARSDSYPDLEGFINPRLGLVFEPIRDNYIKILYGQAFRAPAPYEKFYFNATTSKANPDLKPELIDTYQVSYEQSLPVFYLSLSIYRNLISNLITEVLDPGDGLLQYQNIDKIDSLGAEFYIKRTLAYGRSYAYFGCALQRSIDVYSNKELTDSPGFSANTGLVYSFVPGTSLATEIIYLSKRKTLAEKYTDPYYLTNLALTTENLFGLAVTMKVNNLFDTQYADPASVELAMDTVEQDGRTYLVSVGRKF